MEAVPNRVNPLAGLQRAAHVDHVAGKDKEREERLAAALEGMTLHAGGVDSVFTGEVKDQSQLYGLLDRLRDLGLELISVQPQAGTFGAPEEDETVG